MGGLHFAQVYPVVAEAKQMLARKRVVVLENNATGQFADVLERELGITVDRRILKYDGNPFAVEEVITHIKSDI